MINIDSEFQALIPPLSPEERRGLEENIKQYGCRQPLDVWGDILIDGHNRYEICQRLNLPFRTNSLEFSDRDHALLWIIDNQFDRRNLLPYTRGVLALKKEGIFQRIARKNLVTSTGGADPRPLQNSAKAAINTREEIAKIAGVSHDTIAKVKKIEAHATPEVKQKLSTGAMSIHEAHKQIKRDAQKEKRDALRQSVIFEEPITPTVKTPQPGEWWALGRHLLFCGDTSTDAFIKRLSPCAFAFADPPYNANAAEWDNDFNWQHDYLAEVASVVAVTPGIVSIFDFAKITQMPYVWSMACIISNGMTRGAVGFGNWIYTALFSHGSVYRNSQDIITISIKTSETTETEHKGRKSSEFLGVLFDKFTEEGDTILDPFLGSGQTLLVCEKIGRLCIGGEISPAFCAEIIHRWETLTGEKAHVNAI